MSTGDRVLVTGAAGNLGGLAARLLAANGKEVYGTTRRDFDAVAGHSPAVRWLACDLSKPDEVRAAVAASMPTLVLHAVGMAGETDLSTLVDTNVIPLANLIDALTGVQLERLLVVGSAAEYAASGQREPIREDHPLGPSSPYGLSKLFQFELSQMALKAGMPVVYARPFNLIGPGLSCTTAVGDITKRLAEARHDRGSGVLDVGDLDRWRDYVDARDAAAACRILLESAQPGGVYNVCSGVPVQLADVVERLVSLAGGKVRLRRVEVKPSLEFVVGDSTRLRALGWSPAYDLETSLRDGLQEHLNSADGC
jgi:Nucleoside-diphosphate-sugar epimerases